MLGAVNTFTGGIDLAAGTLELTTPAAAGSGSITFSNDPVLQLDGATVTLPNVIQGFVAGDQIELPQVAAGAGLSYTPGTGGGTAIFRVDGSVVASLSFAGSYTQNDFTFSANQLLTDVACFQAGTRIMTGAGEISVEALCPGDLVALAEGGMARVVWLGHRTIDCGRHPRPGDVWPVRVTANAFGTGLPSRDLMLSPSHAVYCDDVLIPVRQLINGTTIAQERPDRVSYWHVELARHDVILADGLPCESYLDTGGRANFANGGVPTVMHPDFSTRVWEVAGYAPLVVSGARVDAVRRQVNALATMRGLAVSAVGGRGTRAA